LKSLLISSLLFSILYFMFTIFRKINYTKYRKQTFRLIWIILILRLVIPSRVLVSKTPIQFNMMDTIAKHIPITLSSDVSAGTVNLLQNLQVPWESYFQYFNKIWAVGFLISIFIVMIHYIYFRISLKKSLLEDSSKVEELINTYRLPISIWITKQNTSPFVTGIFRKILVLPQSFFQLVNQKDLDYIIQHEMTHIKKNDTLVKMLYLVARCIHWFNPLVYIMNKGFSMDLEMACDEAVAETLSKNEKVEYCNVLYKYCTSNSFAYSIYNIAFSQAGIKIKERFDCILRPDKKHGRGIIMMACLLVISTSLFIKVESSQNYSQIGGTTLSYAERGDILIQSEELTDPIILRKIEENSIALEFTNESLSKIDLKDILNSGNIISHISKEDYDMISDLQFVIWHDNNE